MRYLSVICILFLAVHINGQKAGNAVKDPVVTVRGFGFDSRGGKGGRIIRVTNLNRSGVGSLDAAIRGIGPRIVVFEIAGTISLEGRSLGILNPYITIAGHTAPSPGITLVRGGINIGTHDVIIRHIKVRPGEAGKEKNSGWDVDGISTVGGAYNVIIDHCSITWATDENLTASGPQFQGNSVDEWRKNTSHNIMFSNCIIAESLNNSTHSRGAHSKGTLVHDNVTGVLIYRNLYASNFERNPLFGGGARGLIVNNYIYNPGYAGIHYVLSESEWQGREWVTGQIGIVGNYTEYGPDTRNNMPAISFRGPVEVFMQDNRTVSGPMAKPFSGGFTRLFDPPFWPENVEAMPAEEAKSYVLNNAGAFPWDRDEIDRRIIQGVREKRGRIINSENEGGGYPVIMPVMRKFRESDWDLGSMILKAEVSGSIP